MLLLLHPAQCACELEGIVDTHLSLVCYPYLDPESYDDLHRVLLLRASRHAP